MRGDSQFSFPLPCLHQCYITLATWQSRFRSIGARAARATIDALVLLPENATPFTTSRCAVASGTAQHACGSHCARTTHRLEVLCARAIKRESEESCNVPQRQCSRVAASIEAVGISPQDSLSLSPRPSHAHFPRRRCRSFNLLHHSLCSAAPLLRCSLLARRSHRLPLILRAPLLSCTRWV